MKERVKKTICLSEHKKDGLCENCKLNIQQSDYNEDDYKVIDYTPFLVKNLIEKKEFYKCKGFRDE